MHLHRRCLAVFVAACCVLGACSDDKPATTASTSSAPATNGGATTLAPAVGGDADCAALKDSLANIFINWQVVIGLTNSASSEWAQIPIGTITQFGDQLSVATAGLGSDADAAASLAFMSGANDIVVRGLGGDAAAQSDLAAYLGTDTAANIGKQLPISLAYENAGCE
jgi:hypothetical protein